MTKRKIGELEGTPIVTGDKNYANEHEYYMTLNGDNSYQKLEQRTNGDLFRLVLGGGCCCSDYQSSGSIVKDMVEQGSNFNWAKYAIDIPSLPCFKPESEWTEAITQQSLLAMLNDGYTALDSETGTPIESGWDGMIVRITGDNPHIAIGTGELVDCELAISVIPNELSTLTPVRVIEYVQENRQVGSISYREGLWGELASTMLGFNGVYIMPVYEHPELPAYLVSGFSHLG